MSEEVPKAKYLTKQIKYGSQTVTLFSLDGNTWSTRKEELLQIQERHKNERLSFENLKVYSGDKAAAKKGRKPAGTEDDEEGGVVTDDETHPLEDDLEPIEDEAEETDADEDDVAEDGEESSSGGRRGRPSKKSAVKDDETIAAKKGKAEKTQGKKSADDKGKALKSHKAQKTAVAPVKKATPEKKNKPQKVMGTKAVTKPTGKKGKSDTGTKGVKGKKK